MQLTPQESSAAFWNGAIQGAKRSLGYVALIGVPLLACMVLGYIPPTLIGYGAAILTGISTVFTVGMFSGQNALAQYHQTKHNQMYEGKIAKLEGRAPGLDHEVDDIQHSPRISTILEEGARSAGGNFADAEDQREQQQPNKGHTVH